MRRRGSRRRRLLLQGAIAVAAPLFACADGSANAPLDCEDRFLDEDVVVTSQEELDALPTVTGIRSLTIIDSDVTSLERLGCLQRIESLRIENNPELESLVGLEALEDVDGETGNNWLDSTGMMVMGNAQLQTLDGLGGLREVQGILRIEANPSLSDLSGPSPTSSIDHLVVRGNSGLTSLAPLDVIDTTTIRRLTIEDNDNLRSLEPLAVFESVFLYIHGNAKLETLSPLTSVGPGALLSILDNPALRDVDSLTSVTVSDLVLEDNPQVQTLAHVQAIVAFGLVLRHNDSLRDVPTLLEDDVFFPGNLDCEGNFLDYGPRSTVIQGNPSLDTLTGFSGRTWLCKNLEIIDNDALRTLGGLEGVAQVGVPDSGPSWRGDVTIDGNDALETLEALDPSRKGALGSLGNLQISGNPTLPTCDADQLVDGLRGVGWEGTATIEKNGDGPCP